MANNISMGQSQVIIPQNVDVYNDLLRVDRIAREIINKRLNIVITNDFTTSTIATVIIGAIVQQLSIQSNRLNNKVNQMKIDFFGLFDAIFTMDFDDEAIKEGNINVFFEPGELMREITDDGTYLPGKVLMEGSDAIDIQSYQTSEINAAMLANIEKISRYVLINKRKTVIDDKIPMMITSVFVAELVKEMFRRCNETGDPEAVNLNDIVEFRMDYVDGKLKLSIDPGIEAKLLIKNDEMTEKIIGD